MNGYFCQGFNPLLSFPNRAKLQAALAKLKFLVVMDPLRDRDGAVLGGPRRVQSGQARGDQDRGLRAADHLLCRGRGLAHQLLALAAVALAGRHASGRGQDRHLDHGPAPSAAEGALQEGRRRVRRPDPQPALALQGRRTIRRRPRSPRRSTATSWRTCPIRPIPTKLVLQKGKQVPIFAALRDDGSTACGCWIYSGCYNEAGNNMARRDTTDPDNTGRVPEVGVLVAGQSPHPLQSRLRGPPGQALGSQRAS